MGNKIGDCFFKKCAKKGNYVFEGCPVGEDGEYDEDDEVCIDVCLGHYKYLMMESGKY